MRRLLPLLVLLPALALVACKRDDDAAGTPSSSQAALPATPPPPNDTPAGQRIEADVRALADDAMAGRETGTPGYDQAAEYVARRFAEIGLEPGGEDGTFFQRVPLQASTPVADAARLEIHRNGRSIALRYSDQFLPGSSAYESDVSITAPAVFIGHGVHAPHLGHDDLAGLDLRGKIVVMFPDAPAHFADDMRAYYSSQVARASAIAERGAIGWVMLPTPEFAAMAPWEFFQSAAGKPSMSLVDADGNVVDGHPSVRIGAMVNITAADLLFADTGKTASDVFAAAKDGSLKGFDLPGTITITARSRLQRLESRNVVARLPGSDATLAREHVVHTAHLDHEGVGTEIDGDSIYNGALDNALGVAIMLEAARELRAVPTRPRRSSLFVALGAEEQGLLGSRWFVHAPPVDGTLVANLNLDMPVLTAPTTDVVPVGAEHSTLQAAVEQAAADVGVSVSADPFPEQVMFVRSDQFSFVRGGIPAVYLTGGVVGANDDQDPARATAWFLRNCYHKPCDQTDLPIHYGDAARLARLAAGIGRIVGDADAPPRWKEGNFFGKTFGAGRAD